FCSRFGITLEAGNPLPMMLTADPPDHTALRRLVSRAFTPRRVADLEPTIRTLARNYLDGMLGRSSADLIVDYAAPLPMDVISRLLGVPEADQEELRGWSDALLHRAEGEMDVTPAGVDAAYQLYKYFSAFVAERRTGARDDFAAALVAAESEGEQLTNDQVVGFLFLLIIAGNRAERVWDRPGGYDIERCWPTHHVAFGHGIHVCLGAALARLEMRVSLEEYLARYPGYEIDERALERVHSGNVRGYSRMPI